ncbi:uncharacterized protein SPSK_01945 [Sporothrix schenckii 1099-18]|uniref:Uncharacterized protein n=1 Tax=Sporothrix schenckii 1099-18 TaxID=1397361 RepID=A0A0F2MF91_SPOSC|nr:uncharacterized protein SPSK_01945 [Sporothrix schenckii 1099-18]KJR87490.1 hypothetical protein SPSK_01945 [Sporothrix schenckii 1099-18]
METLNPNSEPMMQRISQVSDRVAYLVLMALCEKDTTLQHQASQLLDKFQASTATAAQACGTKRKADICGETNLMVCVDCEGVFTEQSKNGPSVCRFHESYLTPDFEGDFWADHDEDCHGIIDSDFMRAEFPEGFYWECCERANGTPGCQTRDHHVPLEATRKRAKLDLLGHAVAPPMPTAPELIEIPSDTEDEDEDDESDSLRETNLTEEQSTDEEGDLTE